MSKNIVICSDGTGNTFDHHVTNVTHLVQCLAGDNHKQQVIVYDQGVGTSQKRESAIQKYKEQLRDPEALPILDGPEGSRFSPKAWRARWRGLLYGDGIRENVGQMYRKLTDLYDGPEDQVFLFGFSRGAFTVRALAGLLYRCQLPYAKSSDLDSRFERAWSLYEPIHEDLNATAQFCEGQRPCSIHFLGLWDTVKSYGGLDPIMLPHLRHNPIVRNVRHCLALDERRAWFKPTTWGLLDMDGNGAAKRLKKKDLPLYKKQKDNIAEVWFRGGHSDIGGGDDEEVTSRIARQWMLGEAVNVEPALKLNDQGSGLLKLTLEKLLDGKEPRIHDLWNIGWGLIEKIRRQEIDNSGEWPTKKDARGSDGKREPEKSRRGGKVYVHTSVGTSHSIEGEIEPYGTKSLPKNTEAAFIQKAEGEP